MEPNKPDIAQIRKYLNGELNARDMYLLERQAQDDPFLMDVIRGMESSDEDHAPHLTEIDRLIGQRVQQDKRRVIGWRWLPVAASLLIALGIGGWWLKHQPKEQAVVVKTGKTTHQDGVQVKNEAAKPVLSFKKTGIPPVIKPAMIAKLDRAEQRTTINPAGVMPATTITATPNVIIREDTTVYKAAAYPVRANKNQDSIYSKLAEAKAEPNTGNMQLKKPVADTSAFARKAAIRGGGVVKVDTSANKLNQMLLGKVAGVEVEPGGVPPNPIMIRGAGSIAASQQPLILLNGQVIDSKAFNGINPDKITDIKIMKDQSATDLYGSRAANGVILVTTNDNTMVLADKQPSAQKSKKPTVDEVLKKLPGIDVDSAGNVTSKGQPITKVRINGKVFNGGDVQQATKNLPADTVNKAQVIDYYGDQAARTGIKDGSPTKVLNLTLNKINGKVTAKDGNQPLPGASVKVKGGTQSAQTDINGNFTINAPATAELDISYIGFQNQQVKVNGRDSLRVALSTSQNSLNEVVVVGYGQQKRTSMTGSVATISKNDDAKSKRAHPITGWDAYNIYLKNNAKVTDGKTGAVKIAFTMAANGTISNIRIIKSGGSEIDQKAINLIKNGAGWVGDKSGKPREIKLKIRFK